MTFNKTIDPSYETIGRRKRIVGYIGALTDESGVVLHSKEYDNYRDADVALDALKHDLLSDYVERGLVDPPGASAGDDCPDHGPYADDDCPKCDCGGDGRPFVDQAWAIGVPDTFIAPCATCGDPSCYSHPDVPLFDDVARVIDMALGKSHGAASVVAELRRVRARLVQV